MGNSEPVTDALTIEELHSLQEVEAAPSGDPALRFVQQCQDWFEAWIGANKHPLESNGVPASQILLFVFAEAPDIERPRYAGLGSEWQRVFQKAYDQDSQGIMLCNENFATMRRICTSIKSLSDTFSLAMEHLTDNDAFVIIPMSQRRLLCHLPGESLEEWCANPPSQVLRLSTQQLSAAQIEADVQEFHDVNLRYATNPIAKYVWKGKAFPYQLQSSPEGRIQGYLHIHLRASYKHLMGIVNEEVVGKGGRCDITVTWPSPLDSPRQLYTTTMLELKVLTKSRGAAGNKDWALSGITQANKYRLRNSEAVYVCVFDARKDQSDQMPDLDQVAEANDVRLRRYPMEAPVGGAGANDDSDVGDGSDVDDAAPASTAKASKKVGKRATKKIAKKKGKSTR